MNSIHSRLLVWLIGASFKTNSEIFANPGFWPENPTADGYIRGWQTSTPYSFGTFFLNTLWIVLPKIIGTAISCTAVAYGFARFDFPGKKILFGSLIATLLLPNVVTRIPQYLLFRDIGWLDSFLPLWVPSVDAEAVAGALDIQLEKLNLKTEEGGRVAATVPREHKWLAQTPQMFRLQVLHDALADVAGSGFAGITDEASAIERLGLKPRLVEGSAQNFKVTYPADFALAEAILRSRA